MRNEGVEVRKRWANKQKIETLLLLERVRLPCGVLQGDRSPIIALLQRKLLIEPTYGPLSRGIHVLSEPRVGVENSNNLLIFESDVSSTNILNRIVGHVLAQSAGLTRVAPF